MKKCKVWDRQRQYSGYITSLILIFILLSSFKVISHWTAFSGCCRDASRRPERSRRRWLVAETRRPQEVIFLFLSLQVTVNEKHLRTGELIYIMSYEELYKMIVGNVLTFIHTDTQKEIRENDLVLNQRDVIPDMKELSCGLWEDTTIAVLTASLFFLSIFLSFSSQEWRSLTLFVSMHSTAEVAQRFVRLFYDYAQKWYSNVTQRMVDRLLDVSVYFTMHTKAIKELVCLMLVSFSF